MPITDFLESNARLYPQDTALVELRYAAPENGDQTPARFRREITWKQFEEKTNRYANSLLSRGIRKGDKVGILLMNCLEWLPVYFSILKTGAIAVPMNFRYAADEIQYCTGLADVRALIFGEEFIGRIDGVRDGLTGVKDFLFVGEKEKTPSYAIHLDEMAELFSAQCPPKVITDEDDAAIYFSSGTTGFPKAILHSHGGLAASCRTEQKHHGQTKDDVFLCIPPLHHTGAKMHWFGSLISGGKAVILRGIAPEWILRAVSEERVSIVWLLVPWAQDILDALDRGELHKDDYELSQWRLMHIGAQPVPRSLIRRWKTAFPWQDYDTNYGLSESLGPGCVHLGVENIDKVGAIGIAGYGWETRIVDDSGKIVPPETVGELLVKGPGTMRCYYKNPEATASSLKDGWLLTGDMAKTDEDGFIYLVDRKKDIIITGGENIYPVQIEEHLRSHEKIKDAAVIGVPDIRLGEVALAVIEVKEGAELSAEEICTYCEKIPKYKRPRKIVFAPVPRNPTGKIEKNVLRERYGSNQYIEAQTNR